MKHFTFLTLLNYTCFMTCFTNTACLFSSLNTTKRSPASGTSLIPVISTGVDGPADLIRLPKSFTIARIRPYVLPTTIESPTFKVPFCTNNDAAGPRDLSSSASITVPTARFQDLLLILELLLLSQSFQVNLQYRLHLRLKVVRKLYRHPVFRD